jgi:hypothetical protein
MKVIGLSAKVEEILKITHLSQVFQEFPDEQSALQSFPALALLVFSFFLFSYRLIYLY